MIVRELQTLLSFRVDRRGADDFDNQLGRLRNAAAAAAAAIAGAFSIQKIIEAGDALTTTMNRLGASAGPERAQAAFEGLYASARETGIAVEESSKAFMRFSPAMDKAGFSMADTIGLIDGLQKGLLAAGATASESSAVFQQLGQAINSGVFQGEELGSFLENASPTLVQAFADAVGIAREELKEAASDGKLVTKNVLPALVAAAKAGRDEFGKMQVTVALATARSRVALDRFVAEMERATGFTAKLAAGIEVVGRKLDEWRRYIPVVRDTVAELGGLERILSALAIGTVYVTSVIAAMNGVLAATIARVALLTAGFTAVVAAGLLLQDFFTWMQGGDTKTVFGEMFGPFDQVIGPYQAGLDEMRRQLEDVRRVLLGTPDEAIVAWGRLKEFFRTFWNDSIADLPAPIREMLTVRPQASSAAPAAPAEPGFFSRGSSAFGDAYKQDDGAPIGEWLTRELRRGLGALGFRQRVDGPGGQVLLPPGADMLRRMPTTNNTTATQNNTFNQNVTVNATGVSGAEVAAGANAGVERANSGFNGAMEQLSRQFRMSLPGVEGAGGPVGATP